MISLMFKRNTVATITRGNTQMLVAEAQGNIAWKIGRDKGISCLLPNPHALFALFLTLPMGSFDEAGRT